MKTIWSFDIETYFEIVKLAQSHGKQPGESIEEEFIEIMNKKQIKPIGHSELTKEEWLSEAASKGQSILDIETDNKGEQTYKVIKPNEN